jgi:hypothetical protein
MRHCRRAPDAEILGGSRRSDQRNGRSCGLQFRLVLNRDCRIGIGRWHGQALLAQHLRVICDVSARLVKLLFDLPAFPA